MSEIPGLSVIVSAPSGAGKTSIVRYLLRSIPGLEFSVSATSRARRVSEVDGRDYHFISAELFRAKITAGDFVEWEEVYPGQFYGTLKNELQGIWSREHHVVFDVDVVGGLHLKEIFGDRALALFVRPPSLHDLEARLMARGTETQESLAKRMDKAARELTYAPRFDAEVVNDELSRACDEAVALVKEFLKAGAP